MRGNWSVYIISPTLFKNKLKLITSYSQTIATPKTFHVKTSVGVITGLQLALGACAIILVEINERFLWLIRNLAHQLIL